MKTIVQADEPAAIPESSTSIETAHISKFTSTFDLIERWSEFKAVELWQPANNNIGERMSVVLHVV